MVQKWLKYFTEIPSVFLIAKVLDPSMKLDGVYSLIDTYYQALSTLAFIGPDNLVTLEYLNLPNPETVKAQLKTTLDEVYKSYCDTYRHLVQHKSTSKTSSATTLSANPLLAKMHNIMSQSRGTSSQQSELDVYLSEMYVGDCLQDKEEEANDSTQMEVDLLAWWSRRQQQYPILCMMAKEFLAVPASTVAVEQAFSSGGYMLDERRSNLSPSNLEAQVLLKDWTLAERREQEPDWKHIIDDEDAYNSDASAASTNASDGLGDADFESD